MFFNFQFFAFSILATFVCCNSGSVTSSVVELEQGTTTLQQVKDYIQPILYKKLLQSPKDSAVVQQVKTLVSQYVVDTLLDSTQQQVSHETPVRPEHFARQTITRINGTTLININGTLIPIPPAIRSTPAPEHVINQVDRILQNVNEGNITGIVAQSLLINTSPNVQNLVNGIMNLVFCNPFNRLWNRCSGGGGIFGRNLF